jgi:SAM-dependent methyltransferase
VLALVCPRCADPVVAGPDDARCPRGHAYARLGNGYDFVAERTGVHYPARGAERLHRLQREHFWFVSRRALLRSWIRRRLAPRASFVDVGTGSGDVCAALRADGLDAVACDYHLSSEATVRRVSDAIPFHAADVYGLPFRNADGVGLFDVLEHLDRPVDALVEVRRALAPGAPLFVTVPARRELWTNVDLYSGHRLRYDRPTLLGQLEEAGFTLERATYFMLPLVPALIASRSLGAQRMENDLTPEQVEQRLDQLSTMPARPINAVARAVLAVERAWLGVANLPYGTSLLAAARA